MSLKKLGRYDLVRVLGKGAMGIVYEGKDPNLDRRVAIKTVKVENLSEEAAAEYEARFRTEARSAARLQHPHIVSVYDSDRDADIAFLVMEYIQGDDLKHHLDSGVRYSLEQSLKMVRDLLSALDYAHKQGVVHRDVKPANLLIEPGGRVKLTDFGVARMQDSADATRTQGGMVGTLKYMSPEQVQGQKIDSRADLFSVGVVLYQLLTDKKPFDGDNDFSIIHQIIGHEPAPPSSINSRLPSAIDAVVARALAKDRDTRFATARDFAAALQSAMRRAEDATVVPPADPKKTRDSASSFSQASTSLAAGPLSVAGTNGSATTVTQEVELVYWKDVKDSAEPEELEGFLAKFPEGIYADLARRRLRKLHGGPGEQTDIGAPRVGTVSSLEPDLSGKLAEPTAAEALHRTERPPTAAEAKTGEATITVAQPREDDSSIEKALKASLASLAAPAPGTRRTKKRRSTRDAREPAVHEAVARKRSRPVMWAGLTAGAVAAMVVLFSVAKGKAADPTGDAQVARSASRGTADTVVVAATAAPVSAAAPVVPTHSAAPSSAAPAPVAAMPPPAVPAVAMTASAGVVAAGAASAPKRPASGAVKPRRSASDVAVASAQPETAAAPAPPEPRPEPRPVVNAAPVVRSSVPAEVCKDRVFLARQYCLLEECAKPVFQNAPACVRLREEAKLREESRIRN